jgi:anthranilate phosphoribosyltransferase
VEEAARVFRKILAGEGNKSQNAVVAANAGTAIWVDNPGIELKEAIHLAKISLESGKALETFNKLLAI